MWGRSDIVSISAIRTKVAEGGRVVIPAEYRRAMGLHVGDEVVIRLEGDELRLTTLDQAIARAQSTVRKYVSEGRSLVEELLAERRREAERE
jgi:AbrB family looped-hinge helix DNA binding protein